MQCSFRTESDHNCGNNAMKTVNSYKNHNKKEQHPASFVDEVATRLQDIKDREPVGMPIEQAEAVRRYYAAFPALKKGEESPQQYYLPPPAWCRKTSDNKMQSEISPKDWNQKSKRFQGKERRNSYQSQKKNNRRRCNGYSRSFESEELPEWVTSEGVWDMESQDPVREFIRALALDEGYGTCENTVADGPGPDLDLDLYAQFEAKFDRSLEALWARDNTPDDDYQELPIDFAELLASPSDRLWERAPLADAVWTPASPPLHDRLRPLHLASPPPPPPPPPELESFALYDGEELYSALATVADTLRSLTAINHSRDTSAFAEVPPRRPRDPPPAPPSVPAPRAPSTPRTPSAERENLLTSARTHFKPIRREGEAEQETRYVDGATFPIRGSVEPVPFVRSPGGGAFLGSTRYLEYRAEERPRGIDYSRLALTGAQRAAGGALPLRFPLRQCDAGTQTEPPPPPPPAWPACDHCSGAKKMRPDAGIWGSGSACRACGPGAAPRAAAPPAPDEARDWEELLADISAAHAQYAAAGSPAPAARAAEPPPDRKRRHSAALRCARRCAHPHARFLPCCALDRPLTR